MTEGGNPGGTPFDAPTSNKRRRTEERVAAVGGFRCEAVNDGALRPGYGRGSGGVFRVIELTREGGKGTS